jgi:UDP-N-acetylmuramate dehydrogenase
MNQIFYNELLKENPGLNVLLEEPMKNHTTFRIGGPAEFFAEPDEQQLIRICRLTAKHRIPLTIIGNGSNLLVQDRGIRGMVVAIAKNMSGIQIPDEKLAAQDSAPSVHIYAEAGALLSKLANTAARMGLTGMEFAAGIPGSIGGAVVMNAGAYGGEMKDILVSARVLAPDGAVHTIAAYEQSESSTGSVGEPQKCILTIPVQELDLSYRHSIIPEKGYIVLGAEFALRKGDPDTIAQTMEGLRERRIDKQPLEYYSAGSTFKRPEGYFAGKLIMDAGLRGYRVGDAQVSEKHCGFVINRGNATASEVRQLIADVQAKVLDRFEVELEPEIKIIGD